MKKEPIIIYKSGSNMWRKVGSSRVNLEDIIKLIEDNIKFEVIRTSDHRNQTNEVIEFAKNKTWSKEEIKILKQEYGKHKLKDLQKKYFPNKRPGQIKHRAGKEGLTLDNSWEDHEVEVLKQMRKSGVSYAIISKILERPENAVINKANKIGFSYATLEEKEDSLKDAKKITEVFNNLSSLSKGKIAEDLVSIKLIQKGFDIFLPYTPQHQTDLIAINKNKLIKLQVKASTFDAESNRFRQPLLRKNAVHNTRSFYDSKDVDFFIFVCLGYDVLYIVPYHLCKRYKEANLYPHRPKSIRTGFDWDFYINRFDLMKEKLK